MSRASIVKPRSTLHDEGNVALHRFRSAHDIVRHTGVRDRHEIRYLSDTFVVEEPGEQYVGIRKIQLFVCRFVELGSEIKTAAATGIQQRGKNGWRIERRHAKETDRPVYSDQGD